MPKRRREKNSRKLEGLMSIYCEGAKDRSESAYFKSLIDDHDFSDKVKIEVVDTKFTSGKELVKEAIKKKKEVNKAYKNIDDSYWVVYDMDGYTKHADTFKTAEANSINIAFSAISFETWILLHYEYTTKQFKNSEELIKHLKKEHKFEYEKSSTNVYNTIKKAQERAVSNVKKLRKAVKAEASRNTPIYELNPYTDIDKLIEAIKAFAN